MFERRVRLFLAFIFLGGFLLAARAAQVQVLERDAWAERALSAAERSTFIAARRGDLLDVKGRVLATDVPSFEASVNYRAIGYEPDARWLRQEAERRARRLDGWAAADADARALLIAEQQAGVRDDLAAMWEMLATLSGQTPAQVDAVREGIVADVQNKHDRYVARQYGAAVAAHEAAPEPPWYARLVAGRRQPPDEASFRKKQINDQLGFHAVLPDLTQDQYNRLSLAQDRFPMYRADGGAWASILQLRPAVRRNYPYGDVACHVIGRVGIVSAEDRAADSNKEDELRRYALNDRIGREGLEAIAEPTLRGRRGQRFADRSGAQLRAEGADAGADVTATIDVELQRATQAAFAAVNFQTPDPDPAHPTHKIVDVLAMNGAAVVLDVKTNQVRALVSVPTYDLNRFDALYPTLVEDELNRPMANRALADAIEPGSTVKPIVGLGAVTQHLIGATDTIECTGHPIINGRPLAKPRCWTMSMFGAQGLGAHHVVPSGHPHPTGHLTLADAIERSCNVYFVTQGDKLGVEGLSHWMRQFGFGRATGVGLPEARGLVPQMARVGAAERPSAAWYASIGQGPVNATPIQVANEMATIARDGIWMRPRLLVDGTSPATRPADDLPDRYDLHLDPAALRAVKAGMFNVVNSDAGTGKQVRRADVKVAAKTGSATATPLVRLLRDPATREPLRDEGGRPRYELVPYGTHRAPNRELPWYRETGKNDDGTSKGTHSWVAGYAPAEDPQIAFAVYVEYGGSGGSGAGSVVEKMLDACVAQGYLRAGSTARLVPAETILKRPTEPSAADGD